MSLQRRLYGNDGKSQPYFYRLYHMARNSLSLGRDRLQGTTDRVKSSSSALSGTRSPSPKAHIQDLLLQGRQLPLLRHR